MASNRKYDRVVHRIRVRAWPVGHPDRVRTGYSRDISFGGVYVSTNRAFAKHTRVQLEFETPRGGTFFEGLVVHADSVPRELQSIKTGGMGVRFLPAEELVRGLLAIDALRAANPSDTGSYRSRTLPASTAARPASSATRSSSTSASAPRSPALAIPSRAIAAPPVGGSPAGAGAPAARSVARTADPPPAAAPAQGVDYEVRYETVREFLNAYDRDLRVGGLFVRDERQKPADSQIKLALHLPRLESPVITSARVVQAVYGRRGGMAVHIADREALTAVARHAGRLRTG